MAEKNFQENATEAIETVIDVNDKESIVESAKQTAFDIDSRTERHRKHIKRIIAPQYIDDQNVNDNNCVVTYSKEDNSVLGWKINIEKNGPQQPEVYFNLNIHGDYEMFFSSLYRKVLIFCYSCEDERKYLLKYG